MPKVQVTFEDLVTMAERAPAFDTYGQRVRWVLDTIASLEDREAFLMFVDVRNRLLAADSQGEANDEG